MTSSTAATAAPEAGTWAPTCACAEWTPPSMTVTSACRLAMRLLNSPPSSPLPPLISKGAALFLRIATTATESSDFDDAASSAFPSAADCSAARLLADSSRHCLFAFFCSAAGASDRPGADDLSFLVFDCYPSFV